MSCTVGLDLSSPFRVARVSDRGPSQQQVLATMVLDCTQKKAIVSESDESRVASLTCSPKACNLPLPYSTVLYGDAGGRTVTQKPELVPSTDWMFCS